MLGVVYYVGYDGCAAGIISAALKAQGYNEIHLSKKEFMRPILKVLTSDTTVYQSVCKAILGECLS